MPDVAIRHSFGSSVLVLNRAYLAIHVLGLKRAFSLLSRDQAEVIDVEDGQYFNYNFTSWLELSQLRSSLKRPHDDWVRSVRCEVQAPRVIRLLQFDRAPRQTVKFNRRNVFARDRNQCQYCGEHFSTQDLSLDHVHPRSQGGETTWENIVCACIECNRRKGARTPEQAHLRLIRKPCRPKRNPLLTVKLANTKYVSWQSFIDAAYWSADLKPG